LDQAELELNTGNTKINLEEVLKNYYWAYLLSVVTPDTLTYTFNYDKTKTSVTVKGINVATGNAINYIIGKINFRYIKQIESDNITLKYTANYFDKPIETLNYTYFDGVGEMLGEVKNGETILDFYFKGNTNITNKEFAVNFEIAKEDLMDELLNAVYNLNKGKSLNLTKKYDLGNVKPESPKTVKEDKKPKTDETTNTPKQTDNQKPGKTNFYEPKSRLIDKLTDKSKDLKQLLVYLTELEKRNVIITGTKESFETIDNLYAVVLQNNEITAIIKHYKNECFDYLQNKTNNIKDFNGTKILWFEILR